MTERNIVIIGGGAAGLAAAEAARETDPQARITLVCGDGRPPYFRADLWQLWQGAEPDALYAHPAAWYEERRLELVLDRMVGARREQRQIKLATGESLTYDSLVLACGSRSVLPEAEGSDSQHVLTLRTLDDAQELRDSSGAVAVLGYSTLSLRAAWCLSQQGREVTVISSSGPLLPGRLDKEGSVFLLQLAERAGVKIALHGEISRIEKDRVVLADSRAFAAQIVLSMLGVKPQVNLAPFLGLPQNLPFSVDEQLRTAQPNVFAAGQCAEFNGRISNRQTEAQEMARVAGANAAGAERTYSPLPQPYWLHAMGASVWSYGELGAEDSFSRRQLSGGMFAKLFFKAGLLCGAELIGDVHLGAALRQAVDESIVREQAIALLDMY